MRCKIIYEKNAKVFTGGEKYDIGTSMMDCSAKHKESSL